MTSALGYQATFATTKSGRLKKQGLIGFEGRSLHPNAGRIGIKDYLDSRLERLRIKRHFRSIRD